MSKTYDQSTGYHPVETRDLKHSPNCHFYVNGDYFFPGSRVCVSHKIKTLDGFMNELTQTLRKHHNKPGHVRNIYTPRGGSKLRSIDEFKDGERYVASLTDGFRPLPYQEIPNRVRVPRLPLKGYKKIDINKWIEPVRHPRDTRLRNKSGRCQALNENVKGIRLRIHENGFNERPFKVVSIPHKDKDDIIKITDTIAHQLGIRPIMKLYEIISEGGQIGNFKEVWHRMPGHRLDENQDSQGHVELERDMHLLVLPLGNTELKCMYYYLDGKPNFRCSPRTGMYNLYDIGGTGTPYKHGKSLSKYKTLPSIGNSSSPMSNASGSHGHGSHGGGGRSHNRPKNQRPAQPVNYDRDDGVYRAKDTQRHAKDAKQVNESRDTRTERHIDDREAETVDEEDIRHNEKTTPIPPGTELNKQPSKEKKQNAETAKQSKSKEVKKGKHKKNAKKDPVQEIEPVLDNAAESDNVNHHNDNDNDKQEVDIDDSKQVEAGPTEVNDDRENVPMDVESDKAGARDDANDIGSDNGVVNQAPLSTSPPQNLEENEENVPDSQEKVGGDQGPSRIDEHEDESPRRSDPRPSTPPSRAQAREKERKELDEAAAKIQAGFRGHKTRKEYNEKKQQSQARGGKDSPRQASPKTARRDDDDSRKKEEKAATTIQASFRGHQVRKSQGQKVRDRGKSDKEDKAAIKIQSGFRGYKTRKEYAAKKGQKADNVVKDVNDNEKKDESLEKEKRDKAAVKIQSGYRGYKTRKNYRSTKAKNTDDVNNKVDDDNLKKADNKSDSGKEEEAAARIQAGFKGYKGRQEYQAKKKQKQQEDEAASKIQASFKGYRTRKTLARNKKDSQLPDYSNPDKAKPSDTDLDKAAAKIQSGYRGYKVRKEYKTKVIDDGETESDVDQLPESVIARQLSKTQSQFTYSSRGQVASKIQVCFKGFHFRKKNVYDLQGKDFQIDSKQEIQAALKGYLLRKQMKQDQETDIENSFKNKAATTIQAHYRGYRSRKNKIYLTSQVDKLHAAFRGHINRKLSSFQVKTNDIVETVSNCNHFATIIQSLCRGYMTRHNLTLPSQRSPIKSAHSLQGPTKSNENISYWQDSNVKMYSDRTLRLSATKIQSAYRMFKVRNKYGLIKGEHVLKRDKAAIKIQSCYRGHMARKKTSYQKNKNKEPNTLKGSKDMSGEGNKGGSLVSQTGELIEEADKHDQQENHDSIHQKTVSYLQKDSEHVSQLLGNGESKKMLLQGMAAIKIQSVFTGYMVRRREANKMKTKQTSYFEIFDGSMSTLNEKEGNKNSQMGSENENLEGNTKLDHINPINYQQNNGKEESGKNKVYVNEEEVEREVKGRNENHEQVHTLQSCFSDKMDNMTDVQITKINKIQPNDEFDVSSSRSSSRASKRKRRGKCLTLNNKREGESERERTNDSFDTLKTISTLQSKDSNSSVREVEKEGESPREVEDDASELNSMKKNARAIGQVQAAFRAYKFRREVSELLSGGRDLMDIHTVDRAVSALRKDFKLRSAKVRRLASYQYQTRSPRNILLKTDKHKRIDKQIIASTIQIAFRNYNFRKANTRKHKLNDLHQTEHINVDQEELTSIAMRREEAIVRIVAAVQGYRTRKTEINPFTQTQSTSHLYATIQGKHTKTMEKEIPEMERKSKKTIRAAFRGYLTRCKVKQEKKKQNDAKIEAAFRGYRTRKIERRVKSQMNADNLTTIHRKSSRAKHVEMHSTIINRRATQLQAAFAGYQTRKVLISLTRMVEEDLNNTTSLERMGSLSETDDFKLRHRSIAKLQALGAERTESDMRYKPNAKDAVSEQIQYHGNLEDKHVKLPLIQNPTFNILMRPKSGTCLSQKKESGFEGKSKTQPEISQYQKNGTKRDKLHGIEIFIKKKVAATTIQSYAKGFLRRRKQKDNLSKNCNKKEFQRPSSRKSGRSSSKVSFSSTKDRSSPSCVKDEIRARTASIKLEAERRKQILQNMHMTSKDQIGIDVPASQPNSMTEVEKEAPGQSNSKRALTPILSERLVNESDLKEREDRAAVTIQKVYRGYRQRKCLRQQLEGQAELEVEYEEWKRRRISAATAIQSSWRGYTVRRELQKEQEDHDNMVQDPDPFWSTESPPGLLVINIGRSPSEIERANKLYDTCSMLQMVVRASKVRRKMHVRLAIRRNQTADSASKILAAFKGRKRRKQQMLNTCAARIQNVMRGYMARERMQERILNRIKDQHLAATKIQALCKAYFKRIENAAQKEARRKLAEAHNAANTIQNAYRGYSEREELGKIKQIMETQAAVKIQAGVTGRRMRVQICEKQKAANRIIAGYRSYKTRVKMRLYKEKMHRERMACTRLQSSFKSYKKRVERRHNVNKMMQERNAATRLQSVWKSYQERCKIRLLKEKMARKFKASTIIQSSARGKLARIEFHLLKQLNSRREEASVKIQSTFRGYKDRLSVKQLRHAVEVNNAARDIIDLLLNRSIEYINQRSLSAERIQATVKAHATRTKMDRDRKVRQEHRNHFATQIQAVVRAEQGRVLNEYLHELAIKNKAAIKIQSLFRGHNTRKEIARERSMIANIDPPFINARTRSGRMLALSLDPILMNNARSMILFHKKATKLQAAFRARKVRQGVHDRLFVKHRTIEMTPRREKSVMIFTPENRAAILIQKVWRGYSDRKAFLRLITGKQMEWNTAASVIQASVKGYERRKELRQLRERFRLANKEDIGRKRRETADTISYAYRALKRRGEKIALRAEM